MKFLSKALTFVLGGLVGAALGVLFAPRKGSITRARMKSKVDEEREVLDEKKREMLRKKKDMSNKANEQIESLRAILRRNERE